MHLWEYLTILCKNICIITLSHSLPSGSRLEYIERTHYILLGNAAYSAEHILVIRPDAL